MLHFCTKTSVAEIIWVELIFSQNCFRTDAMEERNVCNTNFEKSCELVEVGIVWEFCFDFDNTLRWKMFCNSIDFFTLSAFLSPRQVWLLSTLTWGDQIWKIVTILWISSLLATPEFGNLKHKKKSKKSNKTAMIISTSKFCNLELKKKSNKSGGLVIVAWHWLQHSQVEDCMEVTELRCEVLYFQPP